MVASHFLKFPCLLPVTMSPPLQVKKQALVTLIRSIMFPVKANDGPYSARVSLESHIQMTASWKSSCGGEWIFAKQYFALLFR